MIARLLVLLVAVSACTSSSNTDPMEDCTSCSQLSLRWTVQSAGMAASCTVVNGATVKVVATFQPDGSTTEITGACATGAMLSGALPLGPYQLAFELDDADGNALSTQMTSTTLVAPNVLSEALVTFDAQSHPSTGHAFGTCASGNTCLDPNDTCVVDGTHSYCAPACSHECTAADPYLPDGSMAAPLCVPVGSNGPTVCMLICSSAADCPEGMACDETTHQHCM